MSVLIPAELGSALREATLEYLWRQWSAVGAMVTSSAPARTIVDPEALILMSLWMLEDEARLVDVVWSWTRENSQLLSIQRLRNLRGAYPAEATRRLSGLADLRIKEEGDIRWKSLRGRAPTPLEHRDGKTRAVEPRLNSWATLMLQLRLGMGVGVKADVLTFVLGINHQGAEWANVSMIADSLVYTPAAVRRASDDLARARFIQLLETADRGPPNYRMFAGKPGPWAVILNVSPYQPGWGYWQERYRFIVELLSWLDREARRPSSSYARDVKAREILSGHAAALTRNRIVDPAIFAGAERNAEYLTAATQEFLNWLRNYG